KTRYKSSQCLIQPLNWEIGRILIGYGTYSTGDVLAFLRAVTYDDHLVEILHVLLQDNIDQGATVDGHLKSSVPNRGENKNRIFRYINFISAINIRYGSYRCSFYNDIYSRNGFTAAIGCDGPFHQYSLFLWGEL